MVLVMGGGANDGKTDYEMTPNTDYDQSDSFVISKDNYTRVQYTPSAVYTIRPPGAGTHNIQWVEE